jgi:hypothetical protein
MSSVRWQHTAKRSKILEPGPKISRHSTVNNSATRTSLAMILDAYESPSRRLSHAVSFVSRFEVSDRVHTAAKKRCTINLPGSVQSTLNNSATRTSLAMILDAYESPSPRLSHAVSLVSRFEVPVCRGALKFVDDDHDW